MVQRVMAFSLIALAAASLAEHRAEAADPATSAETDKQRIERLEAIVQDLSRRLAESEARDQAAAQLPLAQQPVLAQEQSLPPQPGIGAEPPAAESRDLDHNLELYGFAQLDAIQDFKRVDPSWDATLRPSRIPTTDGQFGGDGQSVFSVRQSRLGAKASGNIAGKPYEAKFEFDLYGTGVDAGQTTFRLRHAYASWGPFLAGQTNTLFMDADLFPNVFDYWGPTGMVFYRNVQLRFTFLDSNGWKAAIALENPGNDVDPGALRLIDESVATNIRNDEELPDLTGMVRYDGDWGHVQLAGILRKVGYETLGTAGNEPDGSETGWGLNLGTSFKVALATLRLGAVYGKGIASYMNDGGMDLAPSAALVPVPPTTPPSAPFNLLLDAEAVKLLGITAYVDLQWSKQFSSALGYSFTKVDNTNFQDPSAYHKGEYASANLLWSPDGRILTGGELLWGKRTDNDGDSGTDLRLQYSFKWSFSSANIWDTIN